MVVAARKEPVMVPAAEEISDKAIRRWHELLEQRAALASTRCSCGCRCDAGRPRSISHRVGAVGGARDADRRRPI
jgi:hypothetical protein